MQLSVSFKSTWISNYLMRKVGTNIETELLNILLLCSRIPRLVTVYSRSECSFVECLGEGDDSSAPGIRSGAGPCGSALLQPVPAPRPCCSIAAQHSAPHCSTPPILTYLQEDLCYWWNKMVLQWLQVRCHEEIVTRKYLMNIQLFWKRFLASGKRRCFIKSKNPLKMQYTFQSTRKFKKVHCKSSPHSFTVVLIYVCTTTNLSYISTSIPLWKNAAKWLVLKKKVQLMS